MQPVFAAGFAWVILYEPMQRVEMLGALFLLLGIFIAGIKAQVKSKNNASADLTLSSSSLPSSNQ